MNCCRLTKVLSKQHSPWTAWNTGVIPPSQIKHLAASQEVHSGQGMAGQLRLRISRESKGLQTSNWKLAYARDDTERATMGQSGHGRHCAAHSDCARDAYRPGTLTLWKRAWRRAHSRCRSASPASAPSPHHSSSPAMARPPSAPPPPPPGLRHCRCNPGTRSPDPHRRWSSCVPGWRAPTIPATSTHTQKCYTRPASQCGFSCCRDRYRWITSPESALGLDRRNTSLSSLSICLMGLSFFGLMHTVFRLLGSARGCPGSTPDQPWGWMALSLSLSLAARGTPWQTPEGGTVRINTEKDKPMSQ